MFAVCFICLNTPDITYNTFFTACMYAMNFSETYGETCVMDMETGEILRIYNEGIATYDAERKE